MANYVAEALTTIVEDKPKIYYFSDSEITLYRLKKPPGTYKVWVANRLKAIHDLMDSQNWKKVNTTKNPAYVFSRGAYLSEYHGFRIIFPGHCMPTDPKTKTNEVGMVTANDHALDSTEVKKDTQKQAPQLSTLLSSLETEDDVTIYVYCSEVLTKTK